MVADRLRYALRWISRPIPFAALVLPSAAALVLAYYTRPGPSGLPRPNPFLVAAAAALLVASLVVGHRWLWRAVRAETPVIASRSQRRAFAVALLVALAASASYALLDGLLHGLHEPGDASYGANAATGLSVNPRQRAQDMDDAVTVWSRFVRPRAEADDEDACASRKASANGEPLPFPRDCNAPIAVLAWVLGVDTALLVPAYGILLALLLVWGRRAIHDQRLEIAFTAGADAVDRFQRAAKWPARAVLGAAIADWTENVLALWLTADAWAAFNAKERSQASAGALVWSPGAGILTVATTIKWACIAVAIGYLLLVGVLLARHGGSLTGRWSRLRGTAQSLLAVRIQILAVAAFGAALLVHEQVPDVIRRWLDAPQVGLLAVLCTLALALGIWYGGRWMLAVAGSAAPEKDDPAPGSSSAGDGRRAWIFAAAAAVLASLGFALPSWPQTANLAVPLAIVAVVGLLSLPFRGGWEQRRSRVPYSAEGSLVSPLGEINLWAISRERLAGATGRRADEVSEQEIARYHLEVMAANRDGLEVRDRTRVRQGTAELRLPPVPPPPDQPGWGREALPRLLASAVVAILGLAVLRASVGLALYNHLRGLEWLPFFVFAVCGLALLFLAGLGYSLLRRLARRPIPGALPPPDSRSRPAAILLGCVVVWLAIVWSLSGWDLIAVVAGWIGPVGLLAAAVLLMTFTGCAAVAAADRIVVTPWPIFRVVGLRRSPIVSLVALWFVLASILPPEDTLHNALPADQRRHAAAGVARGEVLRDAFDEWRERNCLTGRNSATGEKRTVPLILIASSGGGIRAAAWTSYVLDGVLGYGERPWVPCAEKGGLPDPEDSPRSNWVFAASGVSGGSLGLATYAARLTERDPRQDSDLFPPPKRRPDDVGWVRDRLGDDNLGPALGWMLFVEAPWSLWRFDAAKDRAQVLEETWARSWRLDGVPRGRGLEQGFLALRTSHQSRDSAGRAAHPPVPLLLFNGTSVESGCRFSASALESSARGPEEASSRCLSPSDHEASTDGVLGATIDLRDFLCAGEDISLAKAALLSARFPLISPSGHVEQCPGATADRHRPETFVVDGGYLENSGAATALELWAALAPYVEEHNRHPSSRAYIVPFFLQISNGYGEPAGPGDVPARPEFGVPLSTFGAARNGREAMARQGAQLLFEKPFAFGSGVICGRYARFALRAHPGPQAPLGWTLSGESFEDLVTQFGAARAALRPRERVENWFKDQGSAATCRSDSGTGTP